jgi:hypothetical protein
MYMNLGIAQKLNGELLRDKNKPARSCPQESSIRTDVHTSVPHADLYGQCADSIRVIRTFGEAKPVPIIFTSVTSVSLW